MADTTTLLLTYPKQERVSRSQVIGLLEDDFEREEILSSSGPKIMGTIYFTGSAVAELIGKDIFGLDNANEQASEVAQKAWENHPLTQAEDVAQNAQEQAERTQALKEAQQIKLWQTRVEELNQAISLEDYKQRERDVHRLNEGALTAEDMDLLGLSKDLDLKYLKNRSLLIALGEKKAEIETMVEEQKGKQDQQEVQPPGFQMRRGELEMGYENKSHWTQGVG